MIATMDRRVFGQPPRCDFEMRQDGQVMDVKSTWSVAVIDRRYLGDRISAASIEPAPAGGIAAATYSPAYSFFAATSMGKSASAFFQVSNSASYAFFASALSPAIACARASPSCAWG